MGGTHVDINFKFRTELNKIKHKQAPIVENRRIIGMLLICFIETGYFSLVQYIQHVFF